MTNGVESFSQEMGKFVALVQAELKDYLPFHRALKLGYNFNLASFKRDDEFTFQYLEVTNEGVMLRGADLRTDRPVSHWRIQEQDGRIAIEKFFEKHKVCQGLLEDEHPASRARVESNLLIGMAIALRIRGVLGDFGNPEPDNYAKYHFIQTIVSEERAELIQVPLEYERQRMFELCRQGGLKYMKGKRNV